VQNVFMAEQYYSRPIIFRLWICSSLKEKADPAGSHQGTSFDFEFLGNFEFIVETALGYQSGSWGTCYDEKK
jgi:hypothetical protein